MHRRGVMDERLRRARREGDLELAAALAARASGRAACARSPAGQEASALALSVGGASLTALSPAGARVFEVASGDLLQEQAALAWTQGEGSWSR